MTFWLDAHLDPRLAEWLGVTFGVTAKTLREVGLRDARDSALFEAGGRFPEIVIATKDYDLVELVLRRGAPPRILWLNFGNMRTVGMQLRLRKAFPAALQRFKAGDALVEID